MADYEKGTIQQIRSEMAVYKLINNCKAEVNMIILSMVPELVGGKKETNEFARSIAPKKYGQVATCPYFFGAMERRKDLRFAPSPLRAFPCVP